MFGLLNNPPGCSPILLIQPIMFGDDRASQHFGWN